MVSKEALAEIFAGERKGCHSSRHWHNVATTGVMLALAEGGDVEVVKAFALYHDCRRVEDGEDPEHGYRGAMLAQYHWRLGWLNLTADQMALLSFACEHHTKGSVNEDVTVSCCWDADRLDLVRIGMEVNPEYLGTETAKRVNVYTAGIYKGVCDCG